MKALIKKVVPRQVLNKAVDIRDTRTLNAVSKKKFDLTNLKKAEDLDVGSVLNDNGAQDLWTKDQHDISSVYGSEHAFDGVNPGDRRALYYLVTALKPKSALEIGTHIGASTLYIARALKNISKDSKVTTVDIMDVNSEHAAWKKIGMRMPPVEFAQSLGCEERSNFITLSSQEFMRKTGEKFDFIFLDGDHSSQAVYHELSLALELLNPDGIILLHDYYPDAKPLFSNGTIIAGPYRALNRIQQEQEKICVKPLGELPWPTKLGSNKTSLAIVARK